MGGRGLSSLELSPQRAASAEQPIFDSVGRDPEELRDLFDRILETVPQDQHRALTLREPVQALAGEQRVFDVSVRDTYLALERRTVCAPFRSGCPQGRAHGDAIGPALERALPAVVPRRLQDFQHAELGRVLGVVLVSQQCAAQTLNAPEQAANERALGFRIARRDQSHESYVVSVRRHAARLCGQRVATVGPC